MAKKPEPPKQSDPSKVSSPAWKLLWRKPGEKIWHGVIIRPSRYMLDPFVKAHEDVGDETLVSNL